MGANIHGDAMASAAVCLLPRAQEPQLLVDTDWREEWIRSQRVHKHRDSSEHWDKRAPSFGTYRTQSSYVTQFIEKLGLQPGWSVLDMGCGNGAIAIPLALQGFKVTARDFSQGMLNCLVEEATSAGAIDNIDQAQMSWQDDWQQCGIGHKSIDVVFASRSVITQDLGESLQKMSDTAKRYCMATLSTGYTPKMSPTVLRELGITSVAAYDYVYAFNILVQMGYQPEITYIVSDRIFHFDTFEQANEQFGSLLEHAQTYCDADELAAAQHCLTDWIKSHMQSNERAGEINSHGEIEGAYKIVMPNDVRWACIKWEV